MPWTKPLAQSTYDAGNVPPVRDHGALAQVELPAARLMPKTVLMLEVPYLPNAASVHARLSLLMRPARTMQQAAQPGTAAVS
ncbi:hypothetical protein CF326_g7573 [Tilletia indica]|nr:hypothetical protein CF326_g7573 [Tilletia indica]